MGLVLHANWYADRLYLWGEKQIVAAVRSDPVHSESAGSNGSVPRADSPSPAGGAALVAAGLEEVRAAVGELSADALLASVAEPTELQLLLPAVDKRALASPAAGGAGGVDPGTRVLTAVAALALSPAQAMDLLTTCPDPMPGGCGDTLNYWAILARFNASLITRRQFVPHMDESHGDFLANWRPVVQDRTQLDWLERFAEAMPRVCRAVAPGQADWGHVDEPDADDSADDDDAPVIDWSDPARLVETFLAATADAVIRRALADDEFFRQPLALSRDPLAPPETLWLAALLGSDRVVKGDFSAKVTLSQMVQGWVGQLEPSAAASSLRLDFRLEEPEEPETDEQVEAAVAEVSSVAVDPPAGPATPDETTRDEDAPEEPAARGVAAEEVAADAGGGRNGHPPAAAEQAPAVSAPVFSPQPTAPWRLTLQLQSPDENELPIDARELWYNPSGAVLLGRNLKNRQARLLAELSRAAEIFPALGALRDDPAPVELPLPTADAYAFIRRWAPALREQGFGVVLPEWTDRSEHELGLRLMVRPLDDMPGEWNGPGEDDEPAMNGGRPARRWGEPIELSSGHFGLDSLLEFDWQIAVGDLRLSPAEFRQLADQNVPLVKLKGKWVQVDLDAARRAMQFIDTQGGQKLTLADALRTAYGANKTETGLPVLGLGGTSWIEQLLEQTPGLKVEMYDQPVEFEGTLRPYQLKGLHWMAFLDRIGIGACLADDMGLGKTIQLIALMLHERHGTGPAAAEPENGTPAAAFRPRPGPTLLFAPTSVVGNWVRELQRFAKPLKVLVHHGPERLAGDEFVAAASGSDVVITSYALAHRDAEDLKRVAWHRLALDEAQKIKNPSAASTIAIRGLTAARRVALTGTPIENHLSELWSIMEILNPGLLGTAAEFRERFAVPVEKLGDKDRADQLRKMIRPFVLRRLKTDPEIAGDLPEKMEARVFCNLTPEQAAEYERLVGASLTQIDAATGIRRRGLILSVLTRLKQICDHPALLEKDIAKGTKILDGRSGKCERLMEMLEEVVEEGDAALVFTQFREMGHLLEQMVKERLRVNVQFLHGGTPAKERDNMIERFQERSNGIKVFLLSLRAGGLGLNLTAANHVFHFDRWWNPAVESQATDRAHRVGQTRKVQVHKFVCIGTMEERIDKLLTEKLALADKIIGSGDEWLTSLSTEQLREYLALSQEAVGEF